MNWERIFRVMITSITYLCVLAVIVFFAGLAAGVFIPLTIWGSVIPTVIGVFGAVIMREMGWRGL